LMDSLRGPWKEIWMVQKSIESMKEIYSRKEVPLVVLM
jgi:hypothetical protein